MTSTLNTQSGNRRCEPSFFSLRLPHPRLLPLLRQGGTGGEHHGEGQQSLQQQHGGEPGLQPVLVKAPVSSEDGVCPQVGIQVSCEDLFSGRHWKVCHAHATFVTQRKETGERVRAHLQKP